MYSYLIDLARHESYSMEHTINSSNELGSSCLGQHLKLKIAIEQVDFHYYHLFTRKFKI